MDSSNYPFEIREVDESTMAELRKYYKGSLTKLSHVYIGPKKYLYPNSSDFEKQIVSVYNMEIRPSDVFIVTFPRSGTTMTQELVWLIANNLDYNTASSKHLIERYCVLGSYFINADTEKQRLHEYKQRNLKHVNILTRMVTSPSDVLAAERGQRFIKCHLPLSLLPPETLNTAKVIYVARDPRDLAVSLYHLFKLLKVNQYEGDFKTFWQFFTRGLVIRGPYFEHVKEAWNERHHPNMLFLFYENFTVDLTKEIRKICKFLGKTYDDDQINSLCEHMDLRTFKKNQSVNLDFLEEFDAFVPKEQSFIRKGKVGGWREYFTEEMAEQAKDWMNETFDDTDIKFPEV